MALPDVTGPDFPALRSYASDLTAVGFGLLGATSVAACMQFLSGNAKVAETARRTAVAAGVLVSYPVLMHSLLIGTNTLTAEMIQHPLVRDGLDKAFGEALAAAAITSGISLGLAIGAAFAVLYFLAALFVLKIGLTAALAVLSIAGALVWGLYPLSRSSWLAQAWLSCLVMVIAIPIAWACIFAAAALLASDTLVFDGGGAYNRNLGPDLAEMVKPFAAVACFWMAYRAPGFLLLVARASGGFGVVGTGGGGGGGGGGRGGAGPAAGRGGGPSGWSPTAVVQRGIATTANRFRAIGARAAAAGPAVGQRFLRARSAPPTASPTGRPSASAGKAAKPGAAQGATAPVADQGVKGSSLGSRARRLASLPIRGNDAWRRLPEEGRKLKMSGGQTAARRSSPRSSAPLSSVSRPAPPPQSQVRATPAPSRSHPSRKTRPDAPRTRPAPAPSHSRRPRKGR